MLVSALLAEKLIHSFCFALFISHVLDAFFVLFWLCWVFPTKKTCETKTQDEESCLQVIGSGKPKAGSENYMASTEVINSKFGPWADGRRETCCHFVTCFGLVHLVMIN
ncbi:unnamed protein product [Cuscuta epithymum]|uniref:Uncharacterized protein n=1 Tax=Cuscuta epithymum TaxID=186058 RepID=A0AAV0ETX3_9ASTE|nr:unnamed protein product [Cuscuta epithymum]